MKNTPTIKLCVTVTGKDRSGIIASVTRVFYELKGNLEDASMTILNGEFAMIFIVTIGNAKLGALAQKLLALEKKTGLSIEIRKIPSSLKSKKQSKSNSYLLNVFGLDRAGIVYEVSNLLAKSNLNITDLQSKRIQSGKNTLYGLLLEVDIPSKSLFHGIQSQLAKLARSLKVDFSIKPVEPVTL